MPRNDLPAGAESGYTESGAGYKGKLRRESKSGSVSDPTIIATAGNALAPALAVLQAMGYVVSRKADQRVLYRAESTHAVLIAEDVVSLLGLAKLYEARGPGWQPSDQEVEALLELERKSGD